MNIVQASFVYEYPPQFCEIAAFNDIEVVLSLRLHNIFVYFILECNINRICSSNIFKYIIFKSIKNLQNNSDKHNISEARYAFKIIPFKRSILQPFEFDIQGCEFQFQT